MASIVSDTQLCNEDVASAAKPTARVLPIWIEPGPSNDTCQSVHIELITDEENDDITCNKQNADQAVTNKNVESDESAIVKKDSKVDSFHSLISDVSDNELLSMEFSSLDEFSDFPDTDPSTNVNAKEIGSAKGQKQCEAKIEKEAKVKRTLDSAQEGMEKFLAIDRKRSNELHNRQDPYKQSKIASTGRSQDSFDNVSSGRGRGFRSSQFKFRKKILNKQVRLHNRGPLYGDRAPLLDYEPTIRGTQGIGGNTENIAKDIEKGFVETTVPERRVIGRRISGKTPKNGSYFDERRMLYINDAENFGDDWQPSFDRSSLGRTEERLPSLIDCGTVPEREHLEGLMERRLPYNYRFKNRNIHYSRCNTFENAGRHQMVSADEWLDPRPLSPGYRRHFGVNQKSDFDYIETKRSLFDYDRFEDFEDRYDSHRRSFRGSYELSDEEDHSLHDFLRGFDSRDETVPFNIRDRPKPHRKRVLPRSFDEREGFGPYDLKEERRLHDLRDNPRLNKKGFTEEHAWPGARNLSPVDHRVVDRRSPVSNDDRDLIKGRYHPSVGKDFSPIRNQRVVRKQEYEIGNSYNLTEARKTRQDFIQHHTRKEAKHRIHPGLQPLLDLDFAAGDAEYSNIGRREFESDEDADESESAEYRVSSGPLDLIHRKRKGEQNLRQIDDFHGIRKSERRFFGEMLSDEEHLSSRSASNYVY